MSPRVVSYHTNSNICQPAKQAHLGHDGSADVRSKILSVLCIMISACKTGSAKRITAVTPLFPYSRQPDLRFSKAGAPLSTLSHGRDGDFSFESVPVTPAPHIPKTIGLTHGVDITDLMAKASVMNGMGMSNGNGSLKSTPPMATSSAPVTKYTTHDYENLSLLSAFQSKPGYKQWVAMAGTTYQGFFDIPVDNLHGRSLFQRYIQQNIPNYKEAVIVSPDAGGAKRATAIADSMGMNFALIHKERRGTKASEAPKSSMMLVGDVANRVCIMLDDLADTASTITRAAKLLKRERATRVYALLTHGIFSGDALARINASALDRVVVTNTVAQDRHRAGCPKLEVLDISPLFAEGIRRLHHGESISVLFQYD
ncbi:hypothetical protein P8C59_005877 [Phyllachora maydis]|uniref:Ribose-phosphate pyrophosphokinase N-terminal domain-containing protein n=1 Tax=Phyllachora maydis TaxID=1825666 RepID=A0AAD9I5B4_9PEZI|nr:hypothetical protein P8C59_005877 [Phyllachora maydis]